MSKGDAATLKAMGVPVDAIVSKVRAYAERHTAKVDGKLVKPDAEWIANQVHLAVGPAELAGVEKWVEEQIASLV